MSSRKGNSGFGPVRTVILVIACGVLGFSLFKLAGFAKGYLASRKEYTSLAESYTQPHKPAGDETETGTPAPAAVPQTPTPTPVPGEPAQPEIIYEDADPPLTVNWEELREVNDEITGWLYVDAEPSINYPICQGEDNDYYLHRTFEKQELFAGAIFEDYNNNPDFADPDTIVYGHNMRDGSMFGKLKYMADKIKDKPYFWILTPEGNYRYRIYSIMSTPVDSDVYMLYAENGPEFLKWEQKMQSMSEVPCEIQLLESDKTVVLSTCTSDSDYRRVVIGKCVSSQQPVRKRATPTPMLPDAADYLDDDEWG